jgi:hypothetical protein
VVSDRAAKEIEKEKAKDEQDSNNDSDYWGEND